MPSSTISHPISDDASLMNTGGDINTHDHGNVTWKEENTKIISSLSHLGERNSFFTKDHGALIVPTMIQ